MYFVSPNSMRGGSFVCFSSLLYSPCLEKCSTHSKCSINIVFRDETSMLNNKIQPSKFEYLLGFFK